MVTENGNPRYPPPVVESELRGRRKAPPPPRLDPLTIDPCARSRKPSPRSSPRSPRSPRHYDQQPQPRARSPLPSAPPSATEDRPWLPMSLRAGSPQQETNDDWRLRRPPVARAPPFTPPPDPHTLKWYTRDNDFDRSNHRKAPPTRGGLRISMSTSRLNSRRPRTQESPDRRQELNTHGLPLPRFPSNGPADDDATRSSFNSNITSRSSIEQASGTERSSVLTKSSSITDLSPDTPDAPYGMDGGMSVEDAISMYLDGFSDVTEEPASPKSRADSKAPSITPPPSRDTMFEEPPPPKPTSLDDIPPIPPLPSSTLPEFALSDPEPHSFVSEPTVLESTISESLPTTPWPQANPMEQVTPEPQAVAPEPSPPAPSSPPFPPCPPSQPQPQPQSPSHPESPRQRQPSKIIIPGPVPPPLSSGNDTRDDYGFRKATQYVTLEQYEAWKGSYSNYTAHRRTKWYDLLQEHGLPTTNVTTFPAQSTKLKRFVRKGIPSELRGAAWFWYAGGYELLNRNLGLYDQLVQKVMASPSNDDKEHIERDLHRTFPDNMHFKPDVADDGSSGSSNSQQNGPVETSMIQSLRRVLYAFALHNPKVGYTQSLNFITGMLLLFLPEEKAFWMLHIVTSVYLPGTHEISLEGANIDLWILMVLLRDSMPGIYSKIASMGGTQPTRGKLPPLTVNSRLPDITLGLTNWLMSVFIGTLPLETTLRVWDIFFYEGSKTFFRVSLAIFKACERDILAVSDPMEVFQVVQTVPKKLLDANALLEDSFVRRHRVGQGRIEELRAARRTAVRQEKLRRSVAFSKGQIPSATDDFTVRPRNQTPRVEERVVHSWRQLKQHAFR
ncbi:hypothetical protein N7532_004034 [Penicillium argentinense]|uniref:Rab-GAP TBC domain-containing protein n=1 Tax=Penicillium argentinense TaxID=1131581 RepID=A0A9W9FP28_9EURO|nr:uncharacterized protein N7532_004034 [Penicillium argentinense]KAJ5103505.1 hypothetical protein N7532_004034 [Penicillium argentinense]